MLIDAMNHKPKGDIRTAITDLVLTAETPAEEALLVKLSAFIESYASELWVMDDVGIMRTSSSFVREKENNATNTQD